MARWPADGWRWQVQAAAQRPRPQPEMTTVRPSSRTLPTWKTDGLRLLLTEPSPRQFRFLAEPLCTQWKCERERDIGSRQVFLYRLIEKSLSPGAAASLSPKTQRNQLSTRRRRQLFPSIPAAVGVCAPRRRPLAQRV